MHFDLYVMIKEMITSENKKKFTYRLDIEYDGTNFQGWQIQPGERTIQAYFEAATERLIGEEISVMAAGRTDAGVHAKGQVAHFRCDRYRDPDVVLRALNAQLPPDIRVLRASFESADFHARYSAKWRGYCYRISRNSRAIGRQYAWNCPHKCNLEVLQNAARIIIGDHSFQSFAHESEKESHYLSAVYRADWTLSNDDLEFQIEANRFLHGMVRFLVGTFIDVGRGKIDINEFSRIIEAHDVREAGPKAPACGLTLETVGYGSWPER
jgi:tRNA pseudouridine38-40 synthase